MIFGLVSYSDVISKKFEININDDIDFLPNFNLQPNDECLFLSSHKTSAFVKMKYGMIPFWYNSKHCLYEAPMEGSSKSFNKFGIVMTPEFRKPIREQRGILPVSYFIVQSSNGGTYLVYLKEKDRRPFGLACIWDRWKRDITDHLHYGFSILTSPAYGKFERAGIKRMPAIIDESYYRKWIKSGLPLIEISKMITLITDKHFDAFPISNEILTSKNNDRNLIEAKGEIIEKQQPKPFEHFISRKKKGSDISWAQRRL